MLTSVLVIVTLPVTLATASINEAKFAKQVSSTYNPLLVDKAFAFDCISNCGRSDQCAATNVQFQLRACTYLNETEVDELTSFNDVLYRKTYPPPLLPPTPTPLPTCQNGGDWADTSETYCTCSGTFTGTHCERYWEDCSEGFDLGFRDDGVYTIQPRLAPDPFETYCQLDWGGRTYIQKQEKGINFYRNWQEYQDGFGDVRSNDYWLGLEKIKTLCASKNCRLMVKLGFPSSPTWKQGLYEGFTLSSEHDGYRMNFTDRTPNKKNDLSDGMTELKGARFSTYDRDNDDNAIGSCAQIHYSGWWFKNCTPSNPNGKLKPVPEKTTGKPEVVFWAGDDRGMENTNIFLFIKAT